MHTALLDLEAADYDRRASALSARQGLHHNDSSGPGGHKRGGGGDVTDAPQGFKEEAPEASPLKEDGDHRIVAPRAGEEGGFNEPLPPSEVNTVRNPLTSDADRARMLVLRAPHERAGNGGSSGVHGGSDAEHSDEECIAEGYAQHQVLRSREEQAGERRLDILVKKRQRN